MARFIIFLFLSIQTGFIFAQESIVAEQKQLNFGNYLMQIQDYPRAITEFQRFIFLYPNSSLRYQASFNISSAYFYQNKFEESIASLVRLDFDTLQPPLQNETQYRLGIALLANSSAKPFALRSEDFAKSKTAFAALHPGEIYYEKSQAFLNSYKPDLKDQYKSPILAGALSAIVPGLGSGYAKRSQEGIYTFMIVAIFGLAAIEADKSDKRAFNNAAPLLFGMTFVFYGGGIYTAANSAYLHNSALENNYLSSVLKENDITWPLDY